MKPKTASPTPYTPTPMDEMFVFSKITELFPGDTVQDGVFRRHLYESVTEKADNFEDAAVEVFKFSEKVRALRESLLNYDPQWIEKAEAAAEAEKAKGEGCEHEGCGCSSEQ